MDCWIISSSVRLRTSSVEIATLFGSDTTEGGSKFEVISHLQTRINELVTLSTFTTQNVERIEHAEDVEMQTRLVECSLRNNRYKV